jgi:hypothetical protein
MWQRFLDMLPDILPVPLLALDLFSLAKGIAALLGGFVAILLYARSRATTYRHMFLRRPFVATVALGVLGAFIYFLLWRFVDFPRPALFVIEAVIYGFSYGVLVMVLVLAILLAPARLWTLISRSLPKVGT